MKPHVLHGLYRRVRHPGVRVAALRAARAIGLRTLVVRIDTNDVCEMLGYDPYYLACEGRVLAVVDPDEADDVVAALKKHDAGRDAVVAGRIDAPGARITMATDLGGERFLEELEDDPLPRIC